MPQLNSFESSFTHPGLFGWGFIIKPSLALTSINQASIMCLEVPKLRRKAHLYFVRNQHVFIPG